MVPWHGLCMHQRQCEREQGVQAEGLNHARRHLASFAAKNVGLELNETLDPLQMWRLPTRCLTIWPQETKV